MATKTFWLPTPHLQCVIRNKCRNPEYVVAVGTSPIELPVLTADQAPVYARSIAESSSRRVAEDRYHLFDDALWRPVFARQAPLLMRDFSGYMLADVSDRLDEAMKPSVFDPERPYLMTALRSQTAEGFPRATRLLDVTAGGIRETLEIRQDDAVKVGNDLASNIVVIDGAVYRRAPEPTLTITGEGVSLQLKAVLDTLEKSTARRHREPNKNDFHRPWLDFALHELDYAKIIAQNLIQRAGGSDLNTKPFSRMVVTDDFLLSDGPFGCGSALQMIRRGRGLIDTAAHVVGTFSDETLSAYVALRGLFAQIAPDERPVTARALGPDGERRLSAEIRQFCASVAREPSCGRSSAEPYLREAAAICEMREQMFGPDLDPELADLMA